jgi:cytochrome c oxidase subunit 1
MHFVGMAGVPRRYYENTAFPMFDDLTDIQVLMTVFALIAAGAQLIFAFNFIRSIFYGSKAVQNPWKATSLEWTTPVEHIHGNWPGAIPEVHRWPYDYSKTDENGEYIIPGQDFVPQTMPLYEGEEELQH